MIILILGPKFGIFNIFLHIFFKFRPSQKIWMNPMKLTAQNNPEWYRKCSKIRSGGRFLNLSVSKNLREDIFLQKLTFLKRINKPLRQPWVNLVYKVYLKHRNSILKIWKVQIFHVEIRTLCLLIFKWFLYGIEARGCLRRLSFEKWCRMH